MLPVRKEEQRVIEFAAGNLMQLYLRGIIDESLKDLLRFFTSIPTLDDLSKELKSQKLRTLGCKISLPNFCDLQDHVLPVFKIALEAKHSDINEPI